MKYSWIDEFLLCKKGVNKDFKSEWNWTRYKIDDKLFAAICLDSNNKQKYITLKLSPVDNDFFRNQYEDIIPGYYMNKTHWSSVKADGNVPDEVLKELLDKSYLELLGTFSKKRKAEILGQ